MKESTKAYVAGLMDAEGCFSIYRAKATKATEGKRPYQPRIVLASTDLQIVKWLVEEFGGFYTKHSPSRGRPWYQWNNNSRVAGSAFLSSITPYLKIKKTEAQLLQQFFALGSRMCPDERQVLMEQIRAAKNRECVTTDTLDVDYSDKQTHAYMAGIFDGEGCISASYSPSGKPNCSVKLGNTHKPLILAMQKLYEGQVATTSAHGNNMDFHVWDLTANYRKERFLLCVLPYLRIKREQAKAALNMVRIPKEAPREMRVPFVEQIRSLNSMKIQPDLHGDMQCAPAGTLTA